MIRKILEAACRESERVIILGATAMETEAKEEVVEVVEVVMKTQEEGLQFLLVL